jgi:RNA polymerase sigma-70 factor (ECF subfamily)
MIDQLLTALRSGQVEPLLAPDAVLVCDGGGHVAAPLHPVRDAAEIARLLTLHCTAPWADLSVEDANSNQAIVVRRAGHARAVLCADSTDLRVTHLWLILNPAKLAAWNQQLQG